MKKIAIIVVTYNRLKLLQEEIDSLRSQTFKDYQIIVVNNGSTDSTLDWLNQQDDIITISQNNLGGAGGFYTGLKYATEKGYEYCWVMDDDVFCYPNSLEELYKAYHIKENIGFVCSRVIGINGEPMNTPNINTYKVEDGYNDVIDYVVDFSMVRVIHATFVSVFFSTYIVKELGLPIQEYFIWGDDVEYTQRISKKYSSFVACKSVVVHKRVIQKALNFIDETDSNRIKMNYFKFRNELCNEKRNGNIKSFLNLFLKDFILILKLLLKFKFSHVFIIIKSMISSLFFSPRIQYPHHVK